MNEVEIISYLAQVIFYHQFIPKERSLPQESSTAVTLALKEDLVEIL